MGGERSDSEWSKLKDELEACRKRLVELEALARLAEENPDPVLSAAMDGRILYANPRARRLAAPSRIEPGGRVPERWALKIHEADHSGQAIAFDARSGSLIFSFVVAPVGHEYVNLYGSDVTERRRTEAALRHRLAMEKVVADISSELTALTADQLHAGLTQALGGLGEFVGVDRAFLFETSGPGGKFVTNTYEWCAPGIPSMKAQLHGLSVEQFPWWASQLRERGEVRISSIDLLPPEAAPERALLASQGVRATLAVVLKWDGEARGFLGFDFVRSAGEWSGEDVHLLKVTAGVFANVLRRAEDEERLRLGKASMEEAQALAHLGSWSWEVGAAAAVWSTEQYRIYGRSPEQFIPTLDHWFAAVHLEERPEVPRRVDGLLQHGGSYDIVYRIVRPDGSQRTLRGRARAQLDSAGRVQRILGTDQDITESERIREELERVNRVLHTVSACNVVLARASNEGALLSDMCRILVEVGGYHAAWVARSVGENAPLAPVASAGALGDFLEVLPLGWGDETTPAVGAVRSGRTVLIEDAGRQLSPEARARWQPYGFVSCIALPIIVEQQTYGVISIYSSNAGVFTPEAVQALEELADDLAYGIGTLRSRRERDRALQALEVSEESLRTIIEQEADGMVVLDRDSRMLYVNSAARHMLGRESERLAGRAFGFPIVTGQPAEIAIVRPDGTLNYAEMRAVETEWFKTPAFVVAMHDVTERKRFEQERQRNVEQRQRALVQTIEAIGLAVEKRDPYTAGHQRRVARLATAIATELGYTAERIEGVRLAGMILGVGKIYVPAEILNRPGRLTDTEYRIVKTHPAVGYEIVKGIEFPWPVPDMLLQYHERLDGSGYPNRLADGQIIPEARILMVADVIEAMCAHRPWRPALDLPAALEEIRAKRGTAYDAEVVDACIRVFEEKRFTF